MAMAAPVMKLLASPARKTTRPPISSRLPQHQRNACDELLVYLRVLEKGLVHFGGERARHDAIDGDAQGRPLSASVRVNCSTAPLLVA